MLNDWTSITDELPTAYMPVLLWVGPGNQHGCTVGYLDRTNISQDVQYIKIQTLWYDIFGDRIYDVVAWQPLPFGPNGEAVVNYVLMQRLVDARQSV
jgi:hypothetical protein